ncbi:MAG: hypothetical protein CW716_07005 [Candidatus Bathyarchaeum sp.]|nr:MAG: hypothetical protein CW716_07005 [Candidatus Bathyarchaeum sp.]
MKETERLKGSHFSDLALFFYVEDCLVSLLIFVEFFCQFFVSCYIFFRKYALVGVYAVRFWRVKRNVLLKLFTTQKLGTG